jgi:sulfide:quinone oxidoreductase
MNRRTFLKYAGLSTSALAIGSGTAGAAFLLNPEQIKTRARIVIIGAGAGGLTAAAKLVKRLNGAKITIVDGNLKHHYQPGYTLIGCGVYAPKTVTRENKDYIPDNTQWVREMVTEYNPDANCIITTSGKKIKYDYLIISTGTQLNYSQIAGLDENMLGKNGIGSVYHSPEVAEQTWKQVQVFLNSGGRGLFTKPTGKIKCGGAPLKAAFLTESLARKTAKRMDFEFAYFTSKKNLFKIHEINDLCTQRCAEKSITPFYDSALTAIDADRKFAYFNIKHKGRQRFSYDYIHIAPPMSAPDNVKYSPLSWKTGEHSIGGWLEVDKYTLQHQRYPNVFGVGDIVGTPIGKTGASVKYQAPTVAENIISMIQDREPRCRFNGYTSCLLATGMGCAVIVEFDYSNKLTPTIPFLSANADGMIGWNIKVHVIEPLYFQMIQGRIPV